MVERGITQRGEARVKVWGGAGGEKGEMGCGKAREAREARRAKWAVEKLGRRGRREGRNGLWKSSGGAGKNLILRSRSPALPRPTREAAPPPGITPLSSLFRLSSRSPALPRPTREAALPQKTPKSPPAHPRSRAPPAHPRSRAPLGNPKIPPNPPLSPSPGVLGGSGRMLEGTNLTFHGGFHGG
jgi:hypothetical protein